MKLSAASEGQVVRNARNGSFYRYERPERGRVRIQPLELFPNGMLIAKPTPTVVDADLEVALVGDWHEGMRAEGKPSHGREAYERELAACEAELVELLAAYELLPVNGTGKQSRGSWSNKIKNHRSRVEVLKLGLSEPDEDEVRAQSAVEKQAPAFRAHDLALLPSGRAGEVLGVRMGTATVRVLWSKLPGLQAQVPLEVLRPWSQAHVCTV
jgi:hypothetical protein